MTATGPIDTSLEVAKNWEAIDMVIGIKMEGGAHAVDGHTDEGRIEAIFSRKGGELEGGIRINDKVDEEEGYNCVRHALWNQDQRDCENISGRRTDMERVHTSNAGDKVAG